MRGKVEVCNPDKVELTLTLTLTVGEWREIMRELPQKWPHWQLGGIIADAIGKTVGRIETIAEASP